MFVKFITQVSVTCVLERFVRLLINAGLKMAPADSCKQAEVRTWCWLAWYADQLFRCFVSLRNDTSIRGEKTLAAFGRSAKHNPEKRFQCSWDLCSTLTQRKHHPINKSTDSLLLKLISFTALRHKYEASQQSPSKPGLQLTTAPSAQQHVCS